MVIASPDDQIKRLFMQIDANSDGGIDWQENVLLMMQRAMLLSSSSPRSDMALGPFGATQERIQHIHADGEHVRRFCHHPKGRKVRDFKDENLPYHVKDLLQMYLLSNALLRQLAHDSTQGNHVQPFVLAAFICQILRANGRSLKTSTETRSIVHR